MKQQKSIPKHKFTRAATLAGAGARVGASYLKYEARKRLTGNADKSDFHKDTAAEAFDTFSKMKGGPLKLAQMLSMDQNMIPEQYVNEFSKAQYSVPPLSYPLVVRTFQREKGKSPTDIFDHFTREAVAGASIGQVHEASLNGEKLAVKIQYPGVAASLQSDLRMVKPIAMRLFSLDAKAIDPYLNEVEERLVEETDYMLELRRSQELAEQSKHLSRTKFPKFYPDLSSEKILTMEWIPGVLMDEYASSGASQEEKTAVGQALWDFYHHQIHQLRVFHADPHPGNFKVSEGDLWVLDFGCVKSLPEDFYLDYFEFMDCTLPADEERFERVLRKVKLLLPSDTPEQVILLKEVFKESIELLSRPFHAGQFDFGNEDYFAELAAFGEKSKLNPELQALSSARGSADALYLNRTYFGLYHLCGSLGAEVKTSLPEFLNKKGLI